MTFRDYNDAYFDPLVKKDAMYTQILVFFKANIHY